LRNNKGKREVFFRERELVLPGQLLASGGYRAGDGTFREGENLYASVIGLAEVRNDEVRVIPLQGKRYIPKVGDLVIGKIVDVGVTNWLVDINSPYKGILTVNNAVPKPINPVKEDLRRYFNVGDLILAKVVAFDGYSLPNLTTIGKGLGKIRGGKLIEVQPTKVPRIIGKHGSMIKLLKDKLKCEIIIGQNGIVWVKAPSYKEEAILVHVLRKIERESHVKGLTARIASYIDKQLEEGE